MSQSVTITVGGRPCNVSGSAVVNTSSNANVTRVDCSAPLLPWGQYPVVVAVAGVGLAAPPRGASPPSLSVNLTSLSYTAPRLHDAAGAGANCRVSLFGGALLSIAGGGMVPGLNSSELQRSMTAFFDNSSPSITCVSSAAASAPASCTFFGKVTPPLSAITNGTAPALAMAFADASSAATATVRVGRYAIPDVALYAGNATIRSLLRWRVRVSNTSASPTTAYVDSPDVYLEMCSGRTPTVYALSPTSIVPGSAGGSSRDLTLTWGFTMAGTENGVLAPTAIAAPSAASIELEVGSLRVHCGGPVVTARAATATTYNETVLCSLPAYVPPSNYTLWVCVDPFGCGFQLGFAVAPTVTGLSADSPTAAGLVGGVVVTVLGSGFDANATRMSMRFGSAACAVLASNATAVTCRVGAPTPPLNASAPAQALPLYLSAAPNAGELSYPALSFTFDPALTATITDVQPPVISLAGGTRINITGTDFLASPPNLTVRRAAWAGLGWCPPPMRTACI